MLSLELLAPAGTLETFVAAVDSGADAIYAGLPGFNARNLARDLRLEELGAMIDHCHSRGKKLYVAANSLVLEQELAKAIEQLAVLAELQPDGLIVQDLGVIRLVRRYFPQLQLHASTLMGAHNSMAVNFLASLGCRRVVLARELTLKEMELIHQRCPAVELEVFIHGAMCFSYSGLCLFSSYLGGKSGLRGRCVQPCRRAYSLGGQREKKAGKNEGSRYLFSMNDLSGLDVVWQLPQLGVRSLKIEGRLRSAHYVRSVVSAYRLLLDAPACDRDNALVAAREMIGEAMSRKTSPGYFFSPQPAAAISPQHSGNIGIHLGRFSTIKKVGGQLICRFVVKKAMEAGDRLRIQLEPGGERLSFRVRELFVGGQPQAKADAGVRVSFAVPDHMELQAGGYADVYRVDGPATGATHSASIVDVAATGRRLGSLQKTLRDRVLAILAELDFGVQTSRDQAEEMQQGRKGETKRGRPVTLSWWLRTSSSKLLWEKLDFQPDRYLLPLTKAMSSQAGQIKARLGKRLRTITWVLPPIIPENDLVRVAKQIDILIRTGYRNFQIGHVSQIALFGEERVALSCDYTLNLCNSQAVRQVAERGVENCQLSLEMDRDAYRNLSASVKKSRIGNAKGAVSLGLTVYGKPPLFTARLAAEHLPLEKKILSPKKENYVIRKEDGLVHTFADRPFSLLPFQQELQGFGIDYMIIDVSGEPPNQRMLAEIFDRLHGRGRFAKLSTFNYLGKLE